MLTGDAPATAEEKIVFVADKMVGAGWLGFRGRMDDLLTRYGHVFDIRLCEPGTEAVLLELAGQAALGAGDLERLVAPAVIAAAGRTAS